MMQFKATDAIGGLLLRFVLLFIDCKGSNFWWK